MNNKFSIFNFQFSINLKNNNQGTALFMALMILSGVLIVTLGAAALITSGLKQGRTQHHSTKAYFAAEAGAEQVLWEIRKNGFAPGGCSDEDYVDFTAPASCDSSSHVYPLSNNSSYYVNYQTGASSVIFESVGDFSDVKRSVELSY